MHSYQYAVLRCVPRVDREEFLNVGVVLHCQSADYLQASWQVDAARIGAIDPRLDLDSLRAALQFIAGVCNAAPEVGAAASVPLTQRFGFLVAPRSTIVQPGPVHGGLTRDPGRQLEHLHESLAG